jgi:hypothetical protein
MTTTVRVKLSQILGLIFQRLKVLPPLRVRQSSDGGVTLSVDPIYGPRMARITGVTVAGGGTEAYASSITYDWTLLGEAGGTVREAATPRIRPSYGSDYALKPALVNDLGLAVWDPTAAGGVGAWVLWQVPERLAPYDCEEAP